MLFIARRMLGGTLVFSLFFQMQIAANTYAALTAKIAFACWNNWNYEIYVMDGGGGNEARITDNLALDYEPSWSPDGERIAFVSTRDNRTEHIFVMDSDGRNLMQLTDRLNGKSPAWSPDGAKIAFTRNQGAFQVWIMDADGGNQIQLTHLGWNFNPAWSPNGDRIAFVTWKRHGGPEIYVIDQNGGNEERLTHDLAKKGQPSWSPDGQWIAYDESFLVHPSQIYVVKTDGSGRTERLTENLPEKWSPAWSPDSGTIAYVSGKMNFNSTIDLMTTDGKHLKQLSEDGAYCLDPDWYVPAAWSVSPAVNFVTIWGEIKREPSGRR